MGRACPCGSTSSHAAYPCRRRSRGLDRLCGDGPAEQRDPIHPHGMGTALYPIRPHLDFQRRYGHLSAFSWPQSCSATSACRRERRLAWPWRGFAGVVTAIGLESLRNFRHHLPRAAGRIGGHRCLMPLRVSGRANDWLGLAPQVAAAGMLTASTLIMVPLAWVS